MNSTLTDLDEAVRVLREWADTESNVKHVWLFGSRIRGNARADSDLDVAVEPVHCDDVFCEHRRIWRGQLAGRTRLTLDVWEYRPELDDRIKNALTEASRLIFERNP